jgi:large subunit ribosomal protein L22
MEVTAKARFIRMSPRKVRLVAGLIRGLDVTEAMAQLKFSPKAAVRPVAKLVESAVANANHNHHLSTDGLFIKAIMVDDGPTLKRWRARAFGRAASIRKRTSHISIVLGERGAQGLDAAVVSSANQAEEAKPIKKNAAESAAGKAKDDRKATGRGAVAKKVAATKKTKKDE